jgi:hypothetical protein
MRRLTFAVFLLAVATGRAQGGGPDYWIDSAVVDEVQTDEARIVFTVTGPCAIFIQDPDREDRANRVDTRLRRCVITITKEAFEKSGERTLMTWSDYRASAKALAGKTATMQFSSTATITLNKITSIHAGGTCFFKADPKTSP